MQLLKQLSAEIQASQQFSSVVKENDDEARLQFMSKSDKLSRLERRLDIIEESLVKLDITFKENSVLYKLVSSLDGDVSYIKDMHDLVNKIEEALGDLRISIDDPADHPADHSYN